VMESIVEGVTWWLWIVWCVTNWNWNENGNENENWNWNENWN